ncbi:homoserine dehydrogenase (plasmid) [Paraclostridium ghonii]|uniref:homoserine dehydrogenase n=1 Tax=Paraclostridium ghonii TaxID=29358 RepID=UPI0035262084
MNIAILGFGTVGSGVYEIIKNNKSSFLNDINVTKILDLPHNKNGMDIITSDINDILNDNTIDLVVETIGGLHPAYEYIMSALLSKKHVVTANKAVVAAYLNEFVEVSRNNGVKFLFEASAGGGIPWLASLQKARRIDDINLFYGIFNGTSNFILDHMYKNNQDFSEVLKMAQDLGYAEADPSADIDGYDVANKVVISFALAFDNYINIKDFPCFSIAKVTIDDIHYLKEKKKAIKYIGEAALLDGCYEAFVMPNIFDSTTQEANVPTNFNLITLHGETIGDLKFFGQGAGKLPTANAIIQDILDIKSQCIECDAKVDKGMPYCDTLFANRFMIRSKYLIKSENIEKIDEYKGNYYLYTSALKTKEFMELMETVLEKDKNAFVAKVATFKQEN